MFIGRLVCIIERDSWGVSACRRVGVALQAYRRRSPNAWRGAVLPRGRPPRDICFSAQSNHETLQQAAPANNPGRRFTGARLDRVVEL